jgi:predicted DNA-binding transcriptional regulator AlpA
MPIELLTLTDVAEQLGVNRSRAATLSKRPAFPRPYAVTPRGFRLWRRADVERFDAAWTRKVGPPFRD